VTEKNEDTQECELVRVLADGTPVVRWQRVEREVEIDGIEVGQPPPPLYFEILERRLPRLGRRLRCIVHSVTPAGRARASLKYYGWHDKSGDVWLDLATLLVEQGVARVAPGGAGTGVKP